MPAAGRSWRFPTSCGVTVRTLASLARRTSVRCPGRHGSVTDAPRHGRPLHRTCPSPSASAAHTPANPNPTDLSTQQPNHLARDDPVSAHLDLHKAIPSSASCRDSQRSPQTGHDNPATLAVVHRWVIASISPQRRRLPCQKHSAARAPSRAAFLLPLSRRSEANGEQAERLAGFVLALALIRHLAQQVVFGPSQVRDFHDHLRPPPNRALELGRNFLTSEVPYSDPVRIRRDRL